RGVGDMVFCECSPGARNFSRAAPNIRAPEIVRTGLDDIMLGAHPIGMVLYGLHRPKDEDRLETATQDQRIVIFGVTWAQYVTVREALDEVGGLDMSYLDGVLELMSPSGRHELVGTMIGRLVEAWAEERDVPLNGYGTETLRKKLEDAGCEPDKCYFLGPR